MKNYFKICLVMAIVALSSIGFCSDLTKSEHYEECKEFADRFSVYAAEFHDGKVPADKYYSFILDCIEEKDRGENRK